jgi:hypothetical protein
MHGIFAPLRQFVRFAKPWERIVLGVALTVVGILTGFYIASAIGIVLLGLTIAAWVKGRRAQPEAAEAAPAATSEPADQA